MDAALGLFGMAMWIVTVIALAAAITYVVIRISPGGDGDARPKSDA
jgi:hypothetical protein